MAAVVTVRVLYLWCGCDYNRSRLCNFAWGMDSRAGSYSVRPLGTPLSPLDEWVTGVGQLGWGREANEKRHMARAREMPGWQVRKGEGKSVGAGKRVWM